MNAQQEAAVSVLRDLILNARDGQEGFRKAAECIVDDPELKMLLSSLSLQRAKFAGELEAQAIAMGEPHPDQGSSISGTAHRWWMGLKASLAKGDNHTILAECERGEDLAKEAYNHAVLAEVSEGLPDPVREIINRQRREVLAAHNTIRALRDATPSAAAQLMAAAKVRSEQAAREASQAWEQTKSKTREITRSAGGFVRRNPFAILGGALLAGLAVGLVFYAFELRSERTRLRTTPRFNRLLGRISGRAQSRIERAQDRLADLTPSSRRSLGRRFRRAFRQFMD